MRILTRLGLLLAMVTAACAGGAEPGTAPSTALSAAPTIVGGEGCPVDDEAFCAVATQVANALAAGDVERLVASSRVDTIVCAEVTTRYFPGCAEADEIEGHGISDAGLLVTMADDAEYADRLEAAVAAIEPGFSDEHGDGAVRVLGVGTCGPDEPDRRSYHLAWTAAMDGDGGARRIVGSFELINTEDWRIVLWYLDTLEAWQTAGDDPMTEAFCEAGRHPWQS